MRPLAGALVGTCDENQSLAIVSPGEETGDGEEQDHERGNGNHGNPRPQ